MMAGSVLPTARWRRNGPVAVMAQQCSAASRDGVVLAAAPVAASHGLDQLRAGGNAIDAALTAALCETVLLPPKCGLAGDLIALVWEPGADQPEALLAIGGAPAGLAAAAQRGDLDVAGPFSVGVPGAPAGYIALADRARHPLDDHVTPGIALAEGGFTWSLICSELAVESAALVARHSPMPNAYYPDGQPITPDETVTLPGLARALRALATDRTEFLHRSVGQAIVARVAAAGGVLTIDDMAYSRAVWSTPAATRTSRGDWFATPAPTHGPSLLDVIDHCPPGADPTTAIAAVRTAIARRGDTLGDPSGTSMVSAADGEGRLVVIIHSNSFPRFGSGLIVDEYDLILANRAGRGFTPTPGHPNFPAPGRRPVTTLHAWGWRTGDGTRVLGATPGGANQMPWNAQTVLALAGADVIDRTAIGEAIAGPRWQLDPDGGVTAEAGLDIDEASGEVRACDLWELRSAMQIVTYDGSTTAGAVDPRTVGAAISMT